MHAEFICGKFAGKQECLWSQPARVFACTSAAGYSLGMLGGGIFTADGSTPQISLAYSVIVLSLENLPEHAMFLITFLVHSLGF